MKYAHLLSAFYFQPWNILPDRHRALGSIFQQRLRNGQEPVDPPWRPAPAASFGDPIVGPVDPEGSPMIPQMQKMGTVAVIPIQGVLGRHLSFLALWCGGCDYDHIEQMLDIADADPVIETIIFAIDSPGGSNTGCPECAARILASPKHTVAYSDATCCSAAYWLASQCSEIIFSPSAIVANVGSYIAAIDNSREWEMQGWSLELFRSGPYKGAGEDGKAWTAEERAFFQQQVTFAADKFKAEVMGARPGVAAEDLQGQWFFGEQAMDKGLCDDLADCLDHTIAAASV
jgi:ClpP class serine protease